LQNEKIPQEVKSMIVFLTDGLPSSGEINGRDVRAQSGLRGKRNWSIEVRAQSGLHGERKWPLLMALFSLSSSLSLSQSFTFLPEGVDLGS
jgi:hypothetical protein